jgi:hypothetical protein
MPHARFVEILPTSGLSNLGDSVPAYYSVSIRRLAAFMSGLDLMISADSEIMPLAAAAGVSTIGLFGTNDPNIHAPYGGCSFGVACRGWHADQLAEHLVRQWNVERELDVAQCRERVATAQLQT